MEQSLVLILTCFFGLSSAQYGAQPAYQPQPADQPQPSYQPAPYSRSFDSFGSFGSSPSFGSQPSFPSFSPMFSMSAMNQQQNSQLGSQTQGTSASTGDLSADSGQVAGSQTSNTNTSNGQTLSTSGSQGQCQGTNCNSNGASQVGTQGQFQGQSQDMGQFGSMSQGGWGNNGFNLFGQFGKGSNSQLQNQFQSQFQNGGASVGSGTAGSGAVRTNQDTKAFTNSQGTGVQSTNLGQGTGTDILTSGAVQAKGSGQIASESGLQTGDQSQTALTDGTSGGVLGQKGNNAGIKSQQQSQSQGNGAATGEAGVKKGSAQSGQTSNIITNAGGTNVDSQSLGKAEGTGIHVTGAAQAGGSSQNQGLDSFNLNLFDNSGSFFSKPARPRKVVAVVQPAPVVVQPAPVVVQPVAARNY